MKRFRLTDNFYLDEFVCPGIYSQYGSRSVYFLDARIVTGMQFIREQIGKPIHINNWWDGGPLDERGLREFKTKTGAKFSQHKFGRAVDSNIVGTSVKDYFEFVMKHEKYLIENQLITTIENISFTKTWLHCDCRYTGLDHILIVNP